MTSVVTLLFNFLFKLLWDIQVVYCEVYVRQTGMIRGI